MSIKHNKQSVKPDNPNVEISSGEWNDSHAITGSPIQISHINASGSPTASTFLRGDGTWSSASGGTGGLGPYSYIISTDGSYYYAYNPNGTLVYGGSGNAGGVSGTNASAVIQAVINQYPDGIIYIKEGLYNLTASLQLRNDYSFNIRGAGMGRSSPTQGTVLSTGTNSNISVFQITDSGNYSNTFRTVQIQDIFVYATYGYGSGCTGIKCDLPVHGSGAAGGGTINPYFVIRNFQCMFLQYGIVINQIFKSVIDTFRFYYDTNSNGVGIWLKNTTTDMWHCGNSEFRNLFIQPAGGIGLYLDQSGGTGWQNENSFYNLQINGEGQAGGAGIKFYTVGTTGGAIALNHFYSCCIEASTNALVIQGRTTGSGTNGTIFDNTFSNWYSNSISGTDIVVSGVQAFVSNIINGRHADGNLDFSQCSGGSAWSQYGDKIFTIRDFDYGGTIVPPQSGTYIRVKGCENSAVVDNNNIATGTGSQQTIAHGLTWGGTGITPDRIQLTDIDSGITTLYSSASATSTNIYVTATSGKKYLWRAWLSWAI